MDMNYYIYRFVAIHAKGKDGIILSAIRNIYSPKKLYCRFINTYLDIGAARSSSSIIFPSGPPVQLAGGLY